MDDHSVDPSLGPEGSSTFEFSDRVWSDTPRGKLLAAAAHLFKTKGYERTTVRDLTGAVGILSGSIFHHFRSKEEILKAVMLETIEFNTRRMRQAVEAVADPEGKIMALIECELQSIVGETNEAMNVLIYEWRSLSERNQQEVLVLRDRYEALWMATLAAGQRAGVVNAGADLVVLRRLLTGAMSWTGFWYRPHGELSLHDLALQVMLLLR